MKIALCSIGSRGDIQPFLVLGDYLSKRGHKVRVCSAKMYADFAANFDVDYYSFEGDYEKLMNDDEMKKMIGKNPFTMKKKLSQSVYPILENSLDAYYEQAQWADIVIYHPKTLIDSFGHLFPHKLIKAYVVPAFTPTRKFPSPLLQFLPIPKCWNRWTYKMTNALLNTVKTPINNFCEKHNLQRNKGLIDTPMIYGISPSFLSQPKDYPEDHIYTGFWFKSENKNAKLSDEVLLFMNTPKKKLIITFGSMPYKSKIPFENFLTALKQTLDIKILVVKAWGLKDANIPKHEDILAIDRAPFGLLFPLADAVVHHGGAGTTAIALKAGIPQMICPILHPVGDQYFWGKQVERKGLGVAPIPLKKLRPSSLVQSVQQLINNDFPANTMQMSNAIQQEDGLANATELIEKIAVT